MTGPQFHMLILDDPAPVFLGQFHRKMNVRREPLIIHFRQFALLHRHFVEDRRMSFSRFRSDLLP